MALAGGRTIQKLAAAATEGKIFGIDYAAGSVPTSRRTNSHLIDSGRVEIHRASVSQLPFSNDTFDLVTTVESQYYWPDLVSDMKEIFRVLKPGGSLLIIAESYKGGRYEILQRPVMWILRSNILSLDEQHALFSPRGLQMCNCSKRNLKVGFAYVVRSHSFSHKRHKRIFIELYPFVPFVAKIGFAGYCRLSNTRISPCPFANGSSALPMSVPGR